MHWSVFLLSYLHPQLFPSSTHHLFLSSQGACCPQVMFYNCSLAPPFFLIYSLMPQSLCWPLLASVTSELTAGGMPSSVPSHECHSPSHHCNEPSPGRGFLILSVARGSRQNPFLSWGKEVVFTFFPITSEIRVCSLYLQCTRESCPFGFNILTV